MTAAHGNRFTRWLTSDLGPGIRQMLADIGEDARIVKKNLVEIDDCPIHSVELSSHGSDDGFVLLYRIRDPRLADMPKIHIKTLRRKSIPIFGRVVDVSWQTLTGNPEIADRLQADETLKQPIMNSRDVDISSSSALRWEMITDLPELPGDLKVGNAPTNSRFGAMRPDVWNCYRAIAHHLLAFPVN